MQEKNSSPLLKQELKPAMCLLTTETAGAASLPSARSHASSLEDSDLGHRTLLSLPGYQTQLLTIQQPAWKIPVILNRPLLPTMLPMTLRLQGRGSSWVCLGCRLSC